MALPGVIHLLIFSYLPMFGVIIAFKDYRISPNGFLHALYTSPWVGLDNFKFLFSTEDAWIITRNTLFYNIGGIIIGTVTSVGLAIILSQISNRKRVKNMQVGMLFPHFLSWVVISYFGYTFLSGDKGIINAMLTFFNLESVDWYNEPKYWPFIIFFVGTWKGVGNGSIIYFASIMAIDRSYFEAAMIDGANKWQQIRNITIPHLTPLIIILNILAVGGIFRSDFGLFYQFTRNSGGLYQATNVIDTYIYRGLMNNGDFGMSAAAGLYQSMVGLVLILLTNFIAKKIDPDSGLF